MLPGTPNAPPMTTTSESAFTRFGQLLSAAAVLVNGPSAMTARRSAD